MTYVDIWLLTFTCFPRSSDRGTWLPHWVFFFAHLISHMDHLASASRQACQTFCLNHWHKIPTYKVLLYQSMKSPSLKTKRGEGAYALHGRVKIGSSLGAEDLNSQNVQEFRFLLNMIYAAFSIVFCFDSMLTNVLHAFCIPLGNW